MKIVQIELDGAGNLVTIRVEFNHSRRPFSNHHDIELNKALIDIIVKNGGYTWEPGFEFPASTIEEAVSGLIDYQLKKANLIRIQEEGLPDFKEPEDYPDTSHIQSLVDICFHPGMKTKVIIRPDQIFLPHGENEQKQLTGIRITPLDSAMEKCGNHFIKQVQDIVHTPEVKKSFKDSLPKPERKRKTERVVIEHIEIQGDRAVVVKKEIDQPVIQKVPLYKDGEPVMKDGKQITIDAPVYEDES